MFFSSFYYHLPVIVPHQLEYALLDVVSLAPEIHGILFSIPLSEYFQLSNFWISSMSVCLLSSAVKVYPLCAVQIPPQRPADTLAWIEHQTALKQI